MRFFAEECDNLAGFQVLVDAGTGFGGLTAKLVDLLADDYRYLHAGIYIVGYKANMAKITKCF